MNQTNYFVISGVKTRGPRADNIGGGLFSYAEIVDANTIHLTCDYKTNFSGSTSAGIWFLVIAQQWRFAHPNDGYLAYNIPVNIVFCIEAIAETKTATGSWKVYSYDTEKARFQYSQNTVGASFPSDWPLFMLIIGYQQWGYITESSSATDYRLFPVSFTTECFAVCTGSSQRQDNVSVWVNEIDTIKFIVGIGENYTAMPQKNIFYIACGKQQWGYIESVSGQLQQKIVLNIESSFYTFYATSFSVQPEKISVSHSQGSNLYIYHEINRGAFWFFIGKQQWGLTGNDPGDGCASAQLSIPITALIFGQARTTSSEVLSSVFSVDVDNTSTLYIDSSNIQYKGDYAYLIGCKQQWGTFPYNSNRWTYPITFNIIFVALKTTISANTSEVGYPAWYSWSSDVTNTYAPHISSYKGYAIALGMQQWGYEQNNEIVTLLLPYTTAYIPVGCAALLDAEFSLTIQDNSKFYRPVRSTAYWFTIGS